MSKAVASGVRGESQAFSTGEPEATCPCQDPHRMLHAGVFFDGTNNNKDRAGEPITNVVRLWKVWRETSSAEAVHKKKYVDGVGSMDMGGRTRQAGGEVAQRTRWWNPLSAPTAAVVSGGRLIADLGHNVAGLAGGAGGKERLNRAYFWLKDRCGELPKPAMKTVDVYGFSRGAALARTFVNLVNMALREEEPALSVRFVGVFDTVGSFGIAGDDSDPGQNMYIDATDARGVSHYVARHEVRKNFPLTIVTGVDKEYAGVHSDVGGGYPPKDEDDRTNHLAFVCFKDMHTDSRRCDVLLDPWLPEVDGVDVEAVRRAADTHAGPGSPTGVELELKGAQGEFYSAYIHESAVKRSNWWHALPGLGSAWVAANPNKPESSGIRRKFTPKRFKLKGQPPDFDWE